jgi:prepilin-type processing-associated H-X9-DG protein
LERLRGASNAELRQEVVPAANVSYAMNRRLAFAPVCVGGVPLAQFVPVRDHVLEHPMVPLMFDVDAEAMLASPGVAWQPGTPFFSAPAGTLDECNVYSGGAYWFPALRHRGKVSIAFVGGHVVSTDRPLSNPAWDWDYHPPRP